MKRESDRRIICEGKYLRLVDRKGWEYVERIGVSGIMAEGLKRNPCIVFEALSGSRENQV